MIKLNNISKKYDDKPIYNNFSIEFHENKINCILGASGIGKTTLINILSGLEKIDEGTIELPKDVIFSYVFQEPRLLEHLSVYENIELILKNLYDKKTINQIIKKNLELVDMAHYADYKVCALSGGMAQRVAIARAFSYPSNIMILDEPFKSLDIKLETELVEKIKNIWKNNQKTVIFVTHNLKSALQISDYIYVLSENPISIKYYECSDNFNEDTYKKILKFI